MVFDAFYLEIYDRAVLAKCIVSSVYHQGLRYSKSLKVPDCGQLPHISYLEHCSPCFRHLNQRKMWHSL